MPAHGYATEPVLELEAVTKSFPNGTRALAGVDLCVRRGTVHGLVGANGAGKSTLIKCVSGVQPFTSGTLRWMGVDKAWRDPREAQGAGLATIHQHVPLVPTLSVLENVFLWRSGAWRRSAQMRADFDQLIDRLGYRLDPDTIVSSLPIGSRQMVAILQALAIGAEVVIMDEPTASLSEAERRLVLDTVTRLAAAGTTFIFISHFLDEILDVTDHVTVLRDGRAILDEPTETLSEDRLIEAIAGKELMAIARDDGSIAQEVDEPLLEVNGLNAPVGIRDVTFSVSPGEIVGLAGLLGSGRSEILNAIMGADPRASGDVLVAGRKVRGGPGGAVKAGIAYVPEDRVAQGLHPDEPLWKNLGLPQVGRTAWRGIFVRESAEREQAERAIKDLGIVASGPDALPRELSGGNAQKVVIGKWLYADKPVWLLDEPTAGIDVGAKADVLALVQSLAQRGHAIVIACSDFDELLSVATRVLVVRGGRIASDHPAHLMTEEDLIKRAHGLDAVDREVLHV